MIWGVLMANNCLFEDHINKVETKAKCISGWILRSFASRDKDLMLTLYKSLVIPIVDYCSVCSTHQRTDTKSGDDPETIHEENIRYPKQLKNLNTL